MSKKKILLATLLICVFVLISIQGIVKAATTKTLTIVDQREGGGLGEGEDKNRYIYAIAKNLPEGQDVSTMILWKIVEYAGSGYTYDNAIYCLKGGKGFASDDSTGGPIDRKDYDFSYNLKEVGKLPSSYRNQTGTSILPASDENYNAVLWILDNMYLPKHANETERQAMRDKLLSAAFKEELEDTTLVPRFELSQLNLTDDDIEVVQQLAIWHFTNDDEYDMGEGNLPAIQISSDGQDYDGFSMNSRRQEDCNTLYKYLITEAKAHASSYGTEETRDVEEPIKFVDTNLEISYKENDIVVGPFRMEKNSDLQYDLEAIVKDEKNQEIQQYKIFNSNKEEITEGTTLKDLVGQDFYIAVPKEINTEGMSLTLNVTYYETDCTLGIVSDGGAINIEQPVVKVEKKQKTITKTAGLNYKFDLALRKFITGVNNQEVTNRVPQVTVGQDGKITYNHTKEPVEVESGDIVTYTIRIFNEGKINGYANSIVDDVPAGLEFLPQHETNVQYGWNLAQDGKIYTNYLSKENSNENIIKGFDSETMTTPDYKDVKVAFKVTESNSSKKTIINIAEIADDKDANGKEIEDIDSTPGNGIENEDDIDKEYLILKEFDLALRKFITGVNATPVTDRVPQVVIGQDGKITYNHKKDPVTVATGDIVTYTIRIYNEGEVSGYAKKIIDNIPEGLKFIVDNETNIEYRWKLSEDEKTVSTDYLSYERDENNILNKFDSQTMTTPEYKDVKIAFEVIAPNSTEGVITNIAEIADDSDKNGNPTDDIDSIPGNGKEDEDDIDKEHLILKEFDLALRKFITGVNGEEVTDRVPQVTVGQDGKITYSHPKDPIVVANSDIVVYTIRIYNESIVSGYAQEIEDDIPQGLEFLPENEINKQYGWQLSSEGKAIKTSYLSKENSAENIIKGFDPQTMATPDYKDVKVAFRVTEQNLPTDRVIINTAEISKDYNEYNIPDKDSTPGNKIEDEDDIDKEYLKVQYFDLSLLKWVSKVIIVEDGETKETETGHTGLEDPEPIVKVELDRKKLKNTIVKYEFKIKVTNEGQIPGYVKELEDYIPEGLKFYKEDNENWDEVDGRVITTQLENTLLNPGETATVNIVLRWINDENNLGLKQNVAEIAKDYNEKNAHDIDSTPGNKIDGEDDIDDAPVLLSIKTGSAGTFYVLGLGILLIIAGGAIIVKKYIA